MTEFDRRRPGSVFKDGSGKLYEFRPESVSVMVAWPKPRAWKKTRKVPAWRHSRPKISIPSGSVEERIRRLSIPAENDGQLLLPFCRNPNSRSLAWLRWYATIPEDVRNLVSRFPDRQWHLLSFVTRCGSAATDLSLTNPAVAYALASNWVYHRPAVQRPLRSARALLRSGRKQREILGWLGFPDARSARRLLRKVVHESISVPSLLYLRDGMGSPETMRVLSHLRRVNAGVIRLITDPELMAHATNGLIAEISDCRDEDRRPQAAYMLRNSLDFSRVLSRSHGPFPRMGRLDRLREMHASLAADMERASESKIDFAFHPPPVRGTATVVPISSRLRLIEEGTSQHNCLADSFDRGVLDGRTYYYSVLSPERCTLSLKRRGGTWDVGQLERARNQPASRVTRRAVEEWLASGRARDAARDPMGEIEDLPF